MEVKYMKTSHSRAWNANLSLWIYDISNYREYGNKSKYTYIIYQNFGIKYPQKSTSTTPTSAPST